MPFSLLFSATLGSCQFLNSFSIERRDMSDIRAENGSNDIEIQNNSSENTKSQSCQCQREQVYCTKCQHILNLNVGGYHWYEDSESEETDSAFSEDSAPLDVFLVDTNPAHNSSDLTATPSKQCTLSRRPLRYRSKKLALRRRSVHDCPYSAPSPRLVALLRQERSKFRNSNLSTVRRYISLLITIYLTHIMDLYKRFDTNGFQSYRKWAAACIIVSLLWTCFLFLFCTLTLQLLIFVNYFLISLIRFICLLCVFVIITVTTATLFSYQRTERTERSAQPFTAIDASK